MRLTHIIISAICLASLSFSVHGAPPVPPSPDQYNVVWDSPRDDSRGSMPLGNGDIGVYVRVEKTGDLVFYISKSDSWGDDIDGDYGFPKVGRVRVKLNPNPFTDGQTFRQTLRLSDGDILVEGGDSSHHVGLKLWVDANNPVIHLDGTSTQPEQMQVVIDTYQDILRFSLSLFHRHYKPLWSFRSCCAVPNSRYIRLKVARRRGVKA